MDILDIYSDYLISQSHQATATGLAAILDGEISHDQVSRYLRSEEKGSKELWEYIKPEIRKLEQKSGGVLILDDTISEKAYTDENAANCWHFSHAKGRHVKGINLLSCLVRYRDIALPIGYEVVKKDYTPNLKLVRLGVNRLSVKMICLYQRYNKQFIITYYSIMC